MGVTVPIENFFEANVVGNLASPLGIDPANIRVTNILREGSVPGRKRSAGEIATGIELGLLLLLEIIWRNSPVLHQLMLKTLQIYTTTPGPQNSTEPWVLPP